MFRKILIAASCIAIFGGASGMDTKDELVENPIPKIVDHFKAVTPDTTIDAFRASGMTLIKSLKEEKLKMELNNSPEILKNEWAQAIQILTLCISDTLPEGEQLVQLRDEVAAITLNGFYDVSEIILKQHKNGDGIRTRIHGIRVFV
ncbi:MAG: hypothetical protein LBT67_03005 [Holosporaceae bacterium]|jgi:hypothetical protein|nr:hypothetical protein [Holosporaceae bacterium]